MKKSVVLLALATLALSLQAGEVLSGKAAKAKFPASLRGGLKEAKWTRLMPGVEYFFGTFTNLYGNAAEDISVIRVDFKTAPVQMKYIDNRAEKANLRRKTSDVAKRCDALFGINATFPDWYSKTDGKVAKDGHKDGGFAFNDDKTFKFFRRFASINTNDYSNIFATEAYALDNGTITLGNTFGNAPYTFMGEATNNVLYIAVADGRTKRSQGLSYHTTMKFLKEFACFNGMTIDGGGSTTMVIRKDLIPTDVNEVQYVSEGSPDHYTMNHTVNSSVPGNRERAVVNQLMFIKSQPKATGQKKVEQGWR